MFSLARSLRVREGHQPLQCDCSIRESRSDCYKLLVWKQFKWSFRGNLETPLNLPLDCNYMNFLFVNATESFLLIYSNNALGSVIMILL